MPKKQRVIIQSNTSKIYNNPSIDGTANLSITQLLKQQQQQIKDPNQNKHIEASTNSGLCINGNGVMSVVGLIGNASHDYIIQQMSASHSTMDNQQSNNKTTS